MGSTYVVRVTGDCTIGGKPYGVNSIVANMAINTWPTCSVQVLQDAHSDDSATIVDEAVFRQIGEWQDKVLGDGLPAEVWWANDGPNGDLTRISGFVTSAQQMVQYGSLCTEVTIVPDYVQMDALSFSMYQFAAGYNVDAKRKVKKPQLKGKTLMQYIKAVVDELFDEWDKYGEKAMSYAMLSQEEKDMYNRQHEINKKFVHFFYELLENSENTVGDLYKISKMKVLGLEQQEPLFDAIYSCLVQSQGSFLSCICALCNMFRLIYVPQSDNVGVFLPKAETMSKEEKGKGGPDPVVSSQSTVLRSGVLPVGRVFTLLDQNIINCDRSSIKHTFHGSSAKVDIKGPYRTIGIAPPPWIPHTAKVLRVMQSGKVIKPNGVTPDEIHRMTAEAIVQDDSDQYYKEALHEWCKQELADQFIGGSINNLLTFLDDFSCGYRAMAYFGSGFINGCTVQIQLGVDGTGTARTTYTYTHVFYIGANIPEIQ